MSSEILLKAREYEENQEKQIKDNERPVFHLAPRVGWLNDPNGFSFYNGEYHMFYQYHPYNTQWGPMHWGHAVSSDMLNWKYCPAAIAPDEEYDQNGCFSGSAVELPDGKHLLMYTGVKETKQADGTVEIRQTQCAAIGDGMDYVKYSGNPVIGTDAIPKEFSKEDFRDPKIWKEKDGSYRCVVGNRTDDGSGSVLLYRSDDGLKWSFVSVLDRCNNKYGKMWECPDYFELDGKSVLLVSPQDMETQGTDFHCGNETVYIIGELDSKTNTLIREEIQRVDFGIDFYATQTLEAPDGRRIMTAWLQSWDTTSDRIDKCKWFGQLIVPRELHIQDGRLIQNPVRELEALRKNPVEYKGEIIESRKTLDGVSGRVIDMVLEVKPCDGEMYKSFSVEVAADGNHRTLIEYNQEISVISIDRSMSGSRRDVVHKREHKVRDRQGEIKLRLVMDRYSVELFVNDGEQAMSICIYTPQSADKIFFNAEGTVNLNVKKYDLL